MYWTIVTLALRVLLEHWSVIGARLEPWPWLNKDLVQHALQHHTPFVDPETHQAQQLLRDAAARVDRHVLSPGEIGMLIDVCLEIQEEDHFSDVAKVQAKLTEAVLKGWRIERG